MQRLRLQNTYNNETKSFDKNNFELRENEKTIRGKVTISNKDNDRWLSKAISFVAFKSQIDLETATAIRDSRGNSFDADYKLNVGIIKDRDNKPILDKNGKEQFYFYLVINQAKIIIKDVDKHSQEKANGYVDEEIPF